MVRAEQIRTVYREVPLISAATVVGGLLVCVGMSQGGFTDKSFAWLLILYAVQTPSIPLSIAYKRRDPTPDEAPRWGRWLAICAAASGCVWGSAGVLFFPPDLAYQALLIVAMFLVAVSGIGSASVYLPILCGFTITVLCPLAVRTALVGDAIHLILGTGILVLSAFLLFYGRHFNRVVAEAIRMRFENQDLNEALTEEKVKQRTQVLEAANRHKSEFLANMSHELRTPLNAIIGFSEVLRDELLGKLNTKQSEYVRIIYSSGHHLLSLINDILDLSKVEAGRMELFSNRFEVGPAIENVMTLVKERALRNEITLELHIDDDLSECVADERKFKQVLINLVSNAIKFTPKGGKVSIDATRTAEALQVSVTDTGIGIAADDQQAIFEEFRQVGRDSTKTREGTGLGLSLAKKFVELHGGTIGVMSELNRGSTFTFALPQKQWQTN